MAYVYDSNRWTRGVGAIASADASPTRQRRRAQIGRATRARDRAMAAISAGALGVIKLPIQRDGASTYAPVGSPPVQWSPPDSGTTIMTGPPAPPAMMPPVMAPPTSVVMQPGGGGSAVPGTPSGIMMGLPPPVPVLPPTMPLPEAPPVAPASAPDNTTRNMLLIGGAAVAAYLLFFRKRSP